MNYNKLILGGHLTRDPESRTLPSGSFLVSVSVAVNRTWKGQDGEKQEKVSFVDATAFGKTAENIKKFFHKGSPVLFDGRIEQDRWEDKDGQKRSKLQMIIENFTFLPRGSSSADSSSNSGDYDSEEDMPF